MQKMGSCVLALVLVGYCLLQVCGARNVTCTVTQGPDQTTYTIPDEGPSGCSYSWANATDTGHTVLVHEQGWGKDGPVRSANVSIFITSECFSRVINTQLCPSETEEHTSICTVVCPKKVMPPKDYVDEIKKATSRSWIIPVVIIIIIIIIIIFISIIGLLVVLNYFKRMRTYSLVNRRDVEAQAPVGQ